jgi:ABC-2 type transport system permease protein
MRTRPALVIAAKDIRLRFRDRSAIVVGFVAPLAIATLMSFAFQGTEELHVSVGFVDRDHGALAVAFGEVFKDPALRELVTVHPVASEGAARRDVDRRRLDVAVVVPTGFTAAALGDTPSAPPALQVLTNTNAAVAGQLVRSITSSFVAQVNADRLSVATARAAGATAPTLTVDASSLHLPLSLQRRAPSGTQLKAVSYFAPGMAIFFLLFAVGFTSRSFFAERDEGTLDRMAAAPIRPSTILVGKALSVVVYGVASLATMAVVTTVAFGADWGAPLAAALVCLAMVLAVVALTAMVIALSRTDRQAESLSSVVVFSLALLGGNFLFVGAAPAVIRKLALLTPNGWALRAFTDVATTTGGTMHDLRLVAGPVLAMLAFTALVGTSAALLSRRAILR